MRKSIKMAAVMSTAALMSVFAGASAFAANSTTYASNTSREGWQVRGDEWVYIDRYGDVTTDSWERSGAYMYYLGGDGNLLRSSLVDDGTYRYYVNSAGAMVTNEWRYLDNENGGYDDEPDGYWYYFQSSGRAYANDHVSFKTINDKRYTFDSEGRMLTGWLDESGNKTDWSSAKYYCGDENDGSRASGWRVITVDDDDEDKEYFFYFNPSNGEKYAAPSADKPVLKTINGRKYAFDETGKMLSGWVQVDPDAENKIDGYQYFKRPDQGWRAQKIWVHAVPEEDINQTAYDEDSEKWYYVNSQGEFYNSGIKTVNGKKYCFNKDGEMMQGLYLMKLKEGGLIDGEAFKIEDYDDLVTAFEKHESDPDLVTYYFDENYEGSAKTGNQTIELDGEDYNFYFDTTGADKYKGVSEVDKNLLVLGLKYKASRDLNYEAFQADGTKVDEPTEEDAAYLVNTSGSIIKNRKDVHDADGRHYETNKDGIVVKTWFND